MVKKYEQLLPRPVLEKARDLYPHIAAGRIYVNHASTGPLSTRVLKAMESHLAKRSSGEIDTYRSDVKIVGACRSAVQRLINAESPDRIAFVLNTSEGINIVASGLGWKPGDRIMVHNAEFPANVQPYYRLKRLGVEIDFLTTGDESVTPEMVERTLTGRTRLVALSAVQFLSGYHADLAAIGKICREKGVWFVVDGIQAVGAMRVDVQSMFIDALASGAQKWQMSPHGTGFLYLTEALQEAIVPAYVGWLSVEDPWDFFNRDQPLVHTGRRFEGGTLNLPGIIGMNEAIATFLEIGMDHAEAHILALSGLLTKLLDGAVGLKLCSPRDIEPRSGIVTVEPAAVRDLQRVMVQLAGRKIDISLRSGKLRFSPHYYNTPQEIETAVAAVRECLTT